MAHRGGGSAASLENCRFDYRPHPESTTSITGLPRAAVVSQPHHLARRAGIGARCLHSPGNAIDPRRFTFTPAQHLPTLAVSHGSDSVEVSAATSTGNSAHTSDLASVGRAPAG